MDKKGVSTCAVCGETSDQVNLHYSRLLCNGCRAFFKRTVQGKVKFSQCKLRGECQINIASRKNCKPCRYDACLKAGVDKNKVQPSRDATGDSPDKGNGKSVTEPTYPHHQDFRFQQPPFNLHKFYPPVPVPGDSRDLAYQSHGLPSSYDHQQMAPHASLFHFPGNPPQAPFSSFALFPPTPNAVIPETHHGISTGGPQTLMTDGRPDPFHPGFSQCQVAIGSQYQNHNSTTSYLYGKTPNFHPSDVSQFQLTAFSHHGAHGQQMFHNGVFGSPLVLAASHGSAHPIMPFNHGVDRFLTPFTSNSSPLLLVSNLHNNGKEARGGDEEQISSGSQTSERSSAFMIDSLLESESVSESESRSSESNPERSSTSVRIGNVPKLIEKRRHGYSQNSISAISPTENDHRRSADYSHNDSGLPGDRLTSTPNFTENLSPESVEINVVECNTPSPINLTARDQHAQFDSGIDANLHVSNGDPGSFQHLETSGKTNNEVKTKCPDELSDKQAHTIDANVKAENDSLQLGHRGGVVTKEPENSQNGHISFSLLEQNSKSADNDDGGTGSKTNGNNLSCPIDEFHYLTEDLKRPTPPSEHRDAIVCHEKPSLQSSTSSTVDKHNEVLDGRQTWSKDTSQQTQAISKGMYASADVKELSSNSLQVSVPTDQKELSSISLQVSVPTDQKELSSNSLQVSVPTDLKELSSNSLQVSASTDVKELSSNPLQGSPRKRLVRDANQPKLKSPAKSGKTHANENHYETSSGHGHGTDREANQSPTHSTPSKKRCLVELQENNLTSKTLVDNQIKSKLLESPFKQEASKGGNENDDSRGTLSQTEMKKSPRASRSSPNSESAASRCISSILTEVMDGCVNLETRLLKTERNFNLSECPSTETGRDRSLGSKESTINLNTSQNDIIHFISTEKEPEGEKEKTQEATIQKGCFLDLIIEKIRHAKSEKEVAEAKKELEGFYKT